MRKLVRQAYRALPFRRQLLELVRATMPLPRSLYQHLHFEGPFTCLVEPGRSFRIHSSGMIVENDLFWSGYGQSWEATSLRLWARLCRDRVGLILDIGANTGVYSLAAASLAPD